MNKIAFLETSDWERRYLQNYPSFLAQADLFEEALTLENVARFQDYKVISTFINSQLSKEIIDSLPQLKLLATRSTGFDHIDLKACQDRGILVANVPSYGSHTVAEYTFGLLLCLLRKIYDAYHRVRETGSFDLSNLRGRELFRKTLGVIGTGKIGSCVIKIAHGFEMKVLAFDKYPNSQLEQQLDFEYVTLEELLKQADIITLHVPYNKETHHLLNKNNIPLIKRGAYLINTSRGGVIETEALYQALKSHQLAGAALDVLEEEQNIKEEQELLVKNQINNPEQLKITLLNHLFIDLDNVIVTPHNAFNTEEALENIIATTIENIDSYLQGKPKNIVTTAK